MDEIKAKFVRRVKRGINKYKGMLPLKYFNTRRIGNYDSKCMYNEDNKRYDDNEKNDIYRRYGKKKRTNYRDKGKRSLCYIETHSSKDEDGDESNEESLFLAIEERNKEMS